MTARASGAFISLPGPSASAKGTRPKIAARPVMRMGRKRARQAQHPRQPQYELDAPLGDALPDQQGDTPRHQRQQSQSRGETNAAQKKV